MLVVAAAQTVLVFRQEVERTTRWSDRRRSEQTIPDGAKVAADWRMGTLLVFFAPQGVTSNVLDPTFMARISARVRNLRAGLGRRGRGRAGVAARLDSDFVVFVPSAERQLLQARIDHDPRPRCSSRPSDPGSSAAERTRSSYENGGSRRLTPRLRWRGGRSIHGLTTRKLGCGGVRRPVNVGSVEVGHDSAAEPPLRREGRDRAFRAD
jgi:hypothetical protein